MLGIEKQSYLCIDYLEHLRNALNGARNSCSLDQHRQIICSWMHQLLDTCNINREIACFSVNLLDRLLSNIVSNLHRIECDVDNHLGESQHELEFLFVFHILMKLNRSQS